MYQLLIVDDQPDLVEDLATNISWDTLNISTIFRAHSANEAIDILKTTQIDVVITDIRMPGKSGLDLIELIKQTWQHIKCILLSGYDDFEYAQRALQHEASDYLLKPVEDSELLSAVRKAIQSIEQQWKEVASHNKAIQSLRANLPILRSHLLYTLLQRELSYEELKNRLATINPQIELDTKCYMLLLRMEDYFYEQTEQDNSLLEYAICNIAEEIYADNFQLWYTKDHYDYYTFLIIPNLNLQLSDAQLSEVIEQKAAQLQHYVKVYLKGTISIVISSSLTFPKDVVLTYDQLISSFRQRIGSERDFLFSANEVNLKQEHDTSLLSELYTPPLLNHLLEVGKWEAIDEKLNLIFEELERNSNDSYELIIEMYYHMVGALSYSIHRNKLSISTALGNSYSQILAAPNFHTISQLKSWILEAISAYRNSLHQRVDHSRSGVIQKVQEYVSRHLADVSLQSIADHVYLNASYLSKLYKLETGEGISEYITRLRLEKAAYLLRSSNEKIYEISINVGYTKTSYFSKVFKEKYGYTPQEYRDL